MHNYLEMVAENQSVALNFTPPCQNDQFWSDPASNPYTPTLIPQNEWSRKIDPAIWSRKMSDPANLIPQIWSR